jgi:hypothetical protein
MAGEKTFVVTVNGVTYTCRELSGFRLMNVMGQVQKGAGYMFRDAILVSVIEPKLTRKQVEEDFDVATFNGIGNAIMARYDLKSLTEDQPDFLDGSKTT